MTPPDELLSFVVLPERSEVRIHFNQAGLALLAECVKRAQDLLATGRTDHLHFFSTSWDPHGELTEGMHETERAAGATQVHQLNMYFWPSATVGGGTP